LGVILEVGGRRKQERGLKLKLKSRKRNWERNRTPNFKKE
jgi:hypothetical protein